MKNNKKDLNTPKPISSDNIDKLPKLKPFSSLKPALPKLEIRSEKITKK